MERGICPIAVIQCSCHNCYLLQQPKDDLLSHLTYLEETWKWHHFTQMLLLLSQTSTSRCLISSVLLTGNWQAMYTDAAAWLLDLVVSRVKLRAVGRLHSSWDTKLRRESFMLHRLDYVARTTHRCTVLVTEASVIHDMIVTFLDTVRYPSNTVYWLLLQAW